MKYLEIKAKLNNLSIFSTKDILLLEPDFNLNNLSNWVKKGYLIPLRKYFYMFSDFSPSQKDDWLLFQIANQIYYPSYISMETAFSFYHLIPETVYATTSVTTRKTNHFNNALGNFNYRTLKTELFWGYSEVGIEGKTFLLAEPEKALLDYLYLNTELATDADFSELRFNFDEFKTIFSEEKLRKYLGLYGNNCLNDRVEKFLNYYQNA